MSAFRPISSYGFIGNLGTCALVNMDGSIDWCCLPLLDSPSAFASILDPEEGGSFTIQPAEPIRSVYQEYLPETNVLRTLFTLAEGALELTDWFHMGTFTHELEEHQRLPALYRRARVLSGRAKIRVIFDPRMDYGRGHTIIAETEYGLHAECGGEFIELKTDRPFRGSERGHGTIFALVAGEQSTFLCTYGALHQKLPDAEESLEQTINYWRTWVRDCQDDKCPFLGPWHDHAVRSSLVLKILAGGHGIAAAATTSLPEVIGGKENWDYRFSWLRDTSFTIQALTAMGHVQDAREFLDWLCNELCSHGLRPADMRVLYPLHDLPVLEEELPHLRGYFDSRPVRIGNAAVEQRQLDIFGEVLESIFRSEHLHPAADHLLANALANIVETVCDLWREPDSGIWELRGGPKHYTYSKVMCWVALDRGIRMAERQGWNVDVRRWKQERHLIREQVMERGYSEKRHAFTQELDGEKLDATALLFPLLEFLPPDDPRAVATLETIQRELANGALVYRTEEHHGKEGAFCLCSFWLVDALALAGRTEQAEEYFLDLLKRANHLGLYAEQIDPKTGLFLGNFPQAFTHVGLINSAIYLGRMKSKMPPEQPLMGERHLPGGGADL